MRRLPLASAVAVAAVLLATAGCGSSATPTTDPTPAGTAVLDPTSNATPTGTGATASGSTGITGSTATQGSADWPNPEDCVTYNPANLTVKYESGVWIVSDGTKVVLRATGHPDDNVGQKGKALAQRYKSHCYVGRNNYYPGSEKFEFIFDYWRNASGTNVTIPDQEEDCSSYDKGNLTVEDMGSGHGWRVKDHDHVLHLFDNQNDARAGKLVLAKYARLCQIGNSGSADVDDPELVTYSL